MRAPIEVGSTFAGYRIEATVGRGGMGIVYRAADLRLERPVALKLIAPELAEDARFRERFLRESHVAASLDHAHVVPIYEAGEHKGQLFIAMRYVEGEDLKTLLARERRLQPVRALAILEGVADALDVAHRKGLVHRDVKPGNVLLDEREHAYLSDFGLSKQQGSASTQTGGILGTFDYLAPEQIRGEVVDGRSDQYALACVLYEAIAGRPPFRGDSEAETLWAHMQEPPPRLDIQPQLTPVLERALAKDKNARYPTCTEFVAAAAAALGLEPAAKRRRRLRLGRRLLAAGALLLAGGIAAAVILLTRESDGGPVVVLPNSVAVIDPGTNEVVDDVPVGDRPTRIVIGDGAVWVLNADAQTVSRIDHESREVVRTFGIGAVPVDLAVGAGSLWIGSSEPRALFRVDPHTGTVLTKIVPPRLVPNLKRNRGLVPPDAGSVAFGEGAVWFTSGNGPVERIDPRSGAVVATIPGLTRGGVLGGSAFLAVGEGAVWLSGAGGKLVRIDLQTNSVHGEFDLSSRGLDRMATGLRQVWAVATFAGLVWRIEPEAVTPLGSVSVGAVPLDVAVGEGSAWVANSGDGTVTRIDADGRVTATITVGGAPGGIAVGEGLVWVAID